jgi:predicted kinase
MHSHTIQGIRDHFMLSNGEWRSYFYGESRNPDPIFIMLCGVSGSGKTSYRNALVKNTLGGETHSYTKRSEVPTIISLDDKVHLRAKSNGLNYNDIWAEVVGSCAKQAESDLLQAVQRKDVSILVDMTNLTPKSRKSKLQHVPSQYTKIAIYFEVSFEQALLRVNNRLSQVISKEVIQEQHRSFILPSVDEGFDFCVPSNFM